MFQIGFWELVVVAIVALWVLGPEQLPLLAKIAFRYLNKMKHSLEEIKNEILQEQKPIAPKTDENKLL